MKCLVLLTVVAAATAHHHLPALKYYPAPPAHVYPTPAPVYRYIIDKAEPVNDYAVYYPSAYKKSILNVPADDYSHSVYYPSAYKKSILNVPGDDYSHYSPAYYPSSYDYPAANLKDAYYDDDYDMYDDDVSDDDVDYNHPQVAKAYPPAHTASPLYYVYSPPASLPSYAHQVAPQAPYHIPANVGPSPPAPVYPTRRVYL